jgi:hypothetical protein
MVARSLTSKVFERSFESGNALVTRMPAFGCKAMQASTKQKGAQSRRMSRFMRPVATVCKRMLRA